MSVNSTQQTETATRAQVIDVGDLPASKVRRYARGTGEVYFERRGGRTFLVTDR